MAPILGAALIAISRLEDYRHDVFDVIAGSILGSAIAYLNWRRHYPGLRARGCDMPYARNPDNSSVFDRLRDEEDALATETAYDLDDQDDRYALGTGGLAVQR
ncbi:hypothetical protein LTR66_000437 [Elasticomyces elasticus]|nr:hypothetical protein LTR50_006348 [Elasticomyces elasticus]KAK5000751.1 hypothetical protein LTR66_000437 [Elasticomyces elasticus]